MAAIADIDNVVKKARSEAVRCVTIAKSSNSHYSIKTDSKTGKIVVRESAAEKALKR